MTRKRFTAICLLIFVAGYFVGSLQNRSSQTLAKPLPQTERQKVIFLERNPRHTMEFPYDARDWQDGYMRGWDITDSNGRTICEDPYLHHRSIEIECVE